MAHCPACQGDFDASFCPRDGTRLVPLAGAVISDRYRLLRKVGEGAMGEVHEAEHVHLHRRVAVKLLQRRIASEPEAMARFQREARATSGLGHPNIVDTIDFGFAADGHPFLVMEWLDGQNLDDCLQGGMLDVPTVLDIVSQASAGLAAAHDRGVVHRDLKPANLFLTRDHRGALLVKVLDFGIAKLRLHETKLTGTGVLMGTPNYMAPEQAQGGAIDARTDVYSLGVILYELLVGEVPFQGDTPLAVLHQHTARDPDAPSVAAPRRRIAPELDALVLRCLAKRPDDRFASMRELGEAIDAVRDARPAPVDASAGGAPQRAAPPPTIISDDDLAPAPRRRWLWPTLAVIVVLGGGAAAWVAFGHGDEPARRDAGVIVRDAAVASPPADATARDAAARDGAPIVPGLQYALRGQSFVGTLTARPAVPKPGEDIEIDIELTELDPQVREAARAGTLSASIELRYYRDHGLVLQTSRPIDESAHLSVTTALSRPGKHHLHFDLLVDGKEIDHAKLDLYAEQR